MATTPTSGQPITLGSGNQLEALAKLLPAIFGSKSSASSNPGDISALQQLLSQLQGADYGGTLEAIFQQAAGQIPGLQQAFGNAVGARSGNNSAVTAALSQLLQQTTLAGQKQVADQQLQNQQLQAQAGGAIAQATRGTSQTQKQGGIVPQLSAVLGLAQAAKLLTGSKDLEDLGKKMGIGGSRAAVPAPAAPVQGPAMPAVTGAPGAGDAFMPGAMSSAGNITSTESGNLENLLAPFLTGGSVPVPGDAFMPGQLGGGGSVPVEWFNPPGVVPGDAYQPGFDFNHGGENVGGGLGPDFSQYEDYGFGGGVDEFYF